MDNDALKRLEKSCRERVAEMKSLLSRRPKWEPTETELVIIRLMLSEGAGQTKIAARLGVSLGQVNRVMREKHLVYVGRHPHQPGYTPTPEEIKERSEEIWKRHLRQMGARSYNNLKVP